MLAAVRAFGWADLAAQGVPLNATHAAGLYSKACDLGDAMGCSSLGVACARSRPRHDMHSRIGPRRDMHSRIAGRVG